MVTTIISNNTHSTELIMGMMLVTGHQVLGSVPTLLMIMVYTLDRIQQEVVVVEIATIVLETYLQMEIATLVMKDYWMPPL